MKAFITGSRAYGTPREDSDIDLVAMVSAGDLELLRALGETTRTAGREEVEYPDGADWATLRFGRLNLLCVTHEDDYNAWRSGTEELVARRPVTRAEAIDVFDRKRSEVQAARDVTEEAALAGMLAACDDMGIRLPEAL